MKIKGRLEGMRLKNVSCGDVVNIHGDLFLVLSKKNLGPFMSCANLENGDIQYFHQEDTFVEIDSGEFHSSTKFPGVERY